MNKSTIIRAAYCGDLDQLKLLRSNDYNYITELCVAAKEGHLPCVKFLVEDCRVNVNQVGLVGLIIDNYFTTQASPLLCATTKGHLEVIKYLVEKEADVNALLKDDKENYYTPLLVACKMGNLDIVKYFIRKCKVNANLATNIDKNTCLIAACQGNNLHIVQYLIDKQKVKVNASNILGLTALHYATTISLRITELLIKAGAKLTKTDIYGNTPLIVAIHDENIAVINYLISIINENEKFDAYKLIGAERALDFDFVGALKCWRHALTKNPTRIKPLSPLASQFCKINIEFSTTKELESMAFDKNKLYLQALLIRDRILGSKNIVNIKVFRKAGDYFWQNEKFDYSLKLWMTCLDIMDNWIKNPFDNKRANVFLSISFALLKLLEKDEESFIHFVNCAIYAFNTCAKVLHKGAWYRNNEKVKKKSFNPFNYHTVLLAFEHFLYLFAKLETKSYFKFSSEFREKARYAIEETNNLKNEFSPLHFACCQGITTLNCAKFPNVDVVRVLIDVGANVDATDSWGNTPFDIVKYNYSNADDNNRSDSVSGFYYKSSSGNDDDDDIDRNPLFNMDIASLILMGGNHHKKEYINNVDYNENVAAVMNFFHETFQSPLISKEQYN